MRYYTQGRFDEAERAWQRSLDIVEKNVGREHPYVAALVTNLAGLQEERGQVEAAIPLYQRAMAIEEKTLGADHPDFAITVNNLGLAYLKLERLEEAEQMLRRALAIQEKALGPDHPDVANSLNNIAGALLDGDRAEEALPLLDRALAIEAKALREDHPKYAASLRTRAGLLSELGRHEEAQAGFVQALAILRKSLGEQSLEVVATLQAQAEARAKAGDMLAALEHTRAATRILAERFATTSGGAGEAAASEQVAQQSAFLRHVNVLTLVPDSEVEREPRARESFEVGQWARASTVGASVARMAARFSTGDDALATAIRQRQDRIESLRGIEVELFDALGQMPEERDGEAEAALRTKREALRTQLAESDALLAERFPDYLAMTSPRPLPAAEVQTLLRPGEALLAYLVTKRKTFAWVVTRDTVVFRALEIGREDLDSQVQFLRSRLQPDERGQLPALTPATSARLYQSVLAPLVPALGNARRIFVVADGALQSLPLGVLGADGEWLAKKHAFALLPSVSALRALRTFQRGRPGSEPFVGFGDPVLEGRPGDHRGLGLGVVFSTRSTAGLADVAALRQAPPLPETADELRAIANALRAPPASVHLREQATEAAVKSADLSRYRVLAFATHGITAGELVGAAEPGLVLTPPATATAQDDGYLSASEVAQLELNADWVLLSACNTAAPDGKPGAEGLSGLAKAFFHAGSRALLVSNWPVASQSTQTLITDTVRRYADHPEQGKPEALQAAMQHMLSRPETAHPFHWAPFSMVGE
jgi:CHAT domain-containing protein/Tfp pilus assembly protein PilF